MKQINSSASFKTSYIAYVKQEMGLPIRSSKNINTRKVKPNSTHKYYIREAIKRLLKEQINPTYKEIQNKALELYKQDRNNIIKEIEDFEGILKMDNVSLDDALAIAHDKEISYE